MPIYLQVMVADEEQKGPQYRRFGEICQDPACGVIGMDGGIYRRDPPDPVEEARMEKAWEDACEAALAKVLEKNPDLIRKILGAKLTKK